MKFCATEANKLSLIITNAMSGIQISCNPFFLCENLALHNENLFTLWANDQTVADLAVN